jgi:hypothetical protein
MGRPYSRDLRERVVAAVEEDGLSRLDIGCVFVSVGRLFSREFAGVTDPVFQSDGRDGFTREFCRGGVKISPGLFRD